MDAETIVVEVEGEQFQVEQRVAFMSAVIQQLKEDAHGVVVVPNNKDIDGKVFAKIIEFCKYHVDDVEPKPEIVPVVEQPKPEVVQQPIVEEGAIPMEEDGTAVVKKPLPKRKPRKHYEFTSWDIEFFSNVEMPLGGIRLLLAANYFDVVKLHNACVTNIVKYFEPMERKEILKALGAKDMTEEEEQNILKEYPFLEKQ